MPIEVRELIIKTTIESDSPDGNQGKAINEADVQKLRYRILRDCKDLIKKESKKIKDR